MILNTNTTIQENLQEVSPYFQIIQKRLSDERERERELRETAKSNGFLRDDDPLESILNQNIQQYQNTAIQSSLLHLQSKVREHSKEKEENQRLSIILRSLYRNELGDAELFLEQFRGKYVFDASEGKSGEFYFWNGVYWALDSDRQRYKDMERVAKEYEWAASVVTEDKIQKELKSRASALRSSRRCGGVFVFVAVEVPFHGEWDNCPKMLPCLNCIVDLTTGAISPHDPKFNLRHVCQMNYNPEANSSVWDQFLSDIMLGDTEKISFLGRILGAALLGDAKEEKIFYFYGKTGRNGKGTLTQTVEKVLGKLARTFPSEMLLMQRNPPSSGSPSPELANLQGVRLAFFSEINKDRKIDASKVKNLSGRDTISTRRLYSNIDLQIRPSHTMFIQTNFKPKAPSDDSALWKRTVLIPFNAEFIENPTLPHQKLKDSQFKDKLAKEGEGILSWLIDNCLAYQASGLSTPISIIEETEKYREENDGIANFIKERCEQDPVFECSANKMREEIKKYCLANGFNEPNNKEITPYLENIFEKKKTNKGWFWKGISIRPEETNDNDKS